MSPPPTQAPVPLRARPLTAALDGVDVGYVRFGDVEVARLVSAAVRDAQWETIVPAVSDVVHEQSPDAFRARFAASHADGGLGFRWVGEVSGDSDGTLVYTLDGRAATSFEYARIGLTVR